MFAVTSKAALLAAAFVVVAGGAARASTVEVKVPFQFVVHGEMLPAGSYMIDDDGTGVLAIRGEQQKKINMFVMTTPAATQAHDPAGDKPALTFTRGEKTWKLAGVWESASEGRRVVG
jgi:hypothetical protein